MTDVKSYKVDVLYEDNHLLAVYKPCGMPVQGDISGDFHLLLWAEEYLAKKYNKPGKAYVGLIHRIDRPVSGVVLLAKTSKALSRMNEQFKNKEVKKLYHVLATDNLTEESGTLTHYLGKDSKTNRALTYNKPKNGAKKSVLHFRIVRNIGKHTLYEVETETGRFHQVRAQMAKIGAPLAGDVKYGAPHPLKDRSVALHAKSLSFVHPVTKEQVLIEAPYPKSSYWFEFAQ
jgi:23S rRNA pseudouridine1911/1915/1917 synthase